MTREQSQKIQEVERIVDDLCGRANFMTTHDDRFSPLSTCISGSISPHEGYAEDVKAFNKKVHDYALGLLNELKDKYLKIYAEL